MTKASWDVIEVDRAAGVSLLPEERTPYMEKLLKEYSQKVQAVRDARKSVDAPSLTAEEMYTQIGDALERSSGGKSPEELVKSTPSALSSAGLPRNYNSPLPGQTEIVKVIPVDMDRRIEFRTDPTKSNKNVSIVAVKSGTKPGRKGWDPSRPPEISSGDFDLASLSLDPNSGHVSMVKSSYAGAKEGVTERLMLEAAKRGWAPRSSNLLNPGKKLVAKKLQEYLDTPKEKYINKLQNFLTTGKAGKIWSTIPYVGAASALALNPDKASAATELGMDVLTKGNPYTGIMSPTTLDDEPSPQEIQNEQRQKYEGSLRKMMGSARP